MKSCMVLHGYMENGIKKMYQKSSILKGKIELSMMTKDMDQVLVVSYG